MRFNVFDGKAGAWAADDRRRRRAIASTRRHRRRARRGGRADAAGGPLPGSTSRPEKIEWVLQKGTEIGVAAFRIVASDARRGAACRRPRAWRATERIRHRRRASRAAAAVLPERRRGRDRHAARRSVLAIVLATAPASRRSGKAAPRGPRARGVDRRSGRKADFSGRRAAGPAARGWRAASLGPRVLRTETAGAVAAAIILHAWGDLGPPV